MFPHFVDKVYKSRPAQLPDLKGVQQPLACGKCAPIVDNLVDNLCGLWTVVGKTLWAMCRSKRVKGGLYTWCKNTPCISTSHPHLKAAPELELGRFSTFPQPLLRRSKPLTKIHTCKGTTGTGQCRPSGNRLSLSDQSQLGEHGVVIARVQGQFFVVDGRAGLRPEPPPRVSYEYPVDTGRLVTVA